jgi:L-threonylcarbamoyladenylate synthase
MWYCRVSPADADQSWTDAAAAIVRAGGVLAFPTDTLYGLACDPRQASAVAKLYRIKGRAAGQALPLIAGSREQLLACGAVLNPAGRRLAEQFWPGPLSLIVPAWDSLCPDVLGGLSSVAVRVPDHPVARALADALGFPITSTSANRSGCPPTNDPAHVAGELAGALDGLIDAGLSPGGPPSTLVDVSGTDLRLVRAGAVAWERVLESVRDAD